MGYKHQQSDLNMMKNDNSSKPQREMPSVSIIIPVKNERGTIKKIIDELPVLSQKTEIIFVEGYSNDSTWEEIEETVENYKGEKILKYIKQEKEGKVDAVRKGFDTASGDILIIYDGDMSVPPEEIRQFYDLLIGKEKILLNGSRFIYPMGNKAMSNLNYLANKMFSLIFTWLFKQKITDTLCGTKALTKKDYYEIKKERYYFGDFDPFGDFDLLFGATKLNFKIIDVPVNYKERIYGKSNINRWKNGWSLLKMTVVAVKKMKFK